jgi:hypothetical protein
LLRVHRHRLRREDLEDCYSQATLELLAQVKAGGVFASPSHIANALELRFLSRARDRRRALSGRSPMQAAIERAHTLAADAHEAREGVELVDRSAAVEARVIQREELRRIWRVARALSHDQRLVLVSQLSGEPCASVCAKQGWTREKYRKVAQRARARLRVLIADAEAGVPHGEDSSEQISGPAYEHVSPHTP